MRTLVGAAAAALALSLLSALPAAAGNEVPVNTVTSDDGVLYAGCRDHDYVYDFQDAEYADEWSAIVTLRDPSGVDVTKRTIYDGPATGTSWFEICEDMSAGTYTVSAEFTMVNWAGETSTTGPYVDTFEMRYPVSETVVQKVRRGGETQLRVKSIQERPSGLRPASGATIAVQRKVDGKWIAVRGGRMKADKQGVAVLNVKLATSRKVQLRARTLGGDEVYTGSTSRTVTLR